MRNTIIGLLVLVGGLTPTPGATEAIVDVTVDMELLGYVPGGMLTIALKVDDVTDLGIYNYNLVFNYSPAAVSFANGTTAGTLTESWSNYLPNYPAGACSDYDATTPLAGSGTLLIVEFEPVAGYNGPFTICPYIEFQEGNIPASTQKCLQFYKMGNLIALRGPDGETGGPAINDVTTSVPGLNQEETTWGAVKSLFQ